MSAVLASFGAYVATRAKLTALDIGVRLVAWSLGVRAVAFRAEAARAYEVRVDGADTGPFTDKQLVRRGVLIDRDIDVGLTDNERAELANLEAVADAWSAAHPIDTSSVAVDFCALRDRVAANARTCCYCGKPAPGERILDDEDDVPLPLCESCYSDGGPTCDEIRAKLAREGGERER